MILRLDDIQQQIVEQLTGMETDEGSIFLRPGDSLYEELCELEQTTGEPDIRMEICEMLDAVDEQEEEMEQLGLADGQDGWEYQG